MTRLKTCTSPLLSAARGVRGLRGTTCLLLAACASAPRGDPGPGVAAAPAAAGAGWAYVATPGEGRRELRVEASFDPDNGDDFETDEGAARFVSGVERRGDDGAWREVPRRGDSWAVGCARGCQVRYRFALAEAARQLGDVDLARLAGDAVVGSPSTWLLRPRQVAPARPWRLRVDDPTFVSGLTAAEGGGFVAATDDLPEAPYSGFGAFRRHTLRAAGGHVTLALAPESFGVKDEALVAWVQGALSLVGGYFGRVPVDGAAIFLMRSPGQGVAYGRTLGNGGAAIAIDLGAELTDDDLRGDWVLDHELLHLGFPTMPAEQAWIEEGLATYLEPLLRARAGRLTAEQVWADFVDRMPQGQPEPGDRGLDRTATWGRTYWGGAMFCLLADVEIRRRTGGQRSLDDALRAIVDAGGTVARRWPLERALAVGDEATGTHVLAELHAEYGDQPRPFALGAIWASLGVARRGGRVVLDDRAPLAAVRRAITQGGR